MTRIKQGQTTPRARLKDHIVLEGLFEPRALGTFPVLRGFADLRDLAAISVPFEMQEANDQNGTGVTGYQRPLDEAHAEDIKRYLESPQRRFLPEIILSVRGRWKSGTNGIQEFGLENAVLSPDEFAAIRYYLAESEKRKTGNGRRRPLAEVAPLEDHLLVWIPEVKRLLETKDSELLDDFLDPVILMGHISGAMSPRRASDARHTLAVARRDLHYVREYRLIRRIDGNHRLALAEQLADYGTEPTRYRAPFCLVFLGPWGDANDDYEESVIFHTINSTALPLESERALQLILGQSSDFAPPAEEEWQSNRALHLTRLLYAELSRQAAQHPRKIGAKLGSRYLSGIHRAARWLCANDPPLFSDRTTLEEFATQFGNDLASVVQTELGRFDTWVRRTVMFVEFASLSLISTRHISYGREAFDVYSAKIRLQDFWQWVRPMLSLDDDAWPTGEGREEERFQRMSSVEAAFNSHPPDAQQLWRLYEAACARAPRKLFLARWNPGDDHTSADARRAIHRLQFINTTIEQLKTEGVYLELCDIDSRRGGTYPIALEVWHEIKTSEIMLIDLTGERANVMLEAGYGLHLFETGRLLFMFHSVNGSQPPSNLRGFDIITFEDTAEIPDKLRPRLTNVALQRR